MVQALPHLLGFLLPVAVVYGVRLGGFSTFLPVGLLVGYYDADRLVFAGKVGTGFTAAAARELRTTVNAMETKECPFSPPPSGWLGRHAHWCDRRWWQKPSSPSGRMRARFGIHPFRACAAIAIRRAGSASAPRRRRCPRADRRRPLPEAERASWCAACRSATPTASCSSVRRSRS